MAGETNDQFCAVHSPGKAVPDSVQGPGTSAQHQTYISRTGERSPGHGHQKTSARTGAGEDGKERGGGEREERGKRGD